MGMNIVLEMLCNNECVCFPAEQVVNVNFVSYRLHLIFMFLVNKFSIHICLKQRHYIFMSKKQKCGNHNDKNLQVSVSLNIHK